MISQAEKFQAIERLFPHIPSRDKSRIAHMLQHLDNVGAKVYEYVIHNFTQYDKLMQANRSHYYDGSRFEAKTAVMPQVTSILARWR